MYADKKMNTTNFPLIVDPSELYFVGPFVNANVLILKLTNLGENQVVFKIKTTAPMYYCVRPNFGILNPQMNSKIHIILQAFEFDANKNYKHKFLIQCLEIKKPCADISKFCVKSDANEIMSIKINSFLVPANMESADCNVDIDLTNMSLQLTKKLKTTSELSTDSASKRSTKEVFTQTKVQVGSEYQELRTLISTLRQENKCLLQKIAQLKPSNEAVAQQTSTALVPTDSHCSLTGSEQIVTNTSTSNKTFPNLVFVLKEINILPRFFISAWCGAFAIGILLGKYFI